MDIFLGMVSNFEAWTKGASILPQAFSNALSGQKALLYQFD